MAPTTKLALLAVASLAGQTLARPYTGLYVDCSRTKEGSGTKASPWNSIDQVNEQTFQPGDFLLFKAGTTCEGVLQPKGSGTEASPITISKYDDGRSTSYPVINGTGVLGAAVNLTNVDYWTVTNLAVTNPAATIGKRQGINVQATDGETHKGIIIEGNTVFDVAGQTNKETESAEFVDSAGILVGVANGGHFDGVLVRNNKVSDCGGGGIKVRVGILGSMGNNTRVTRNHIDKCGGDGVIVSFCESPLLDYNTASYLGAGKYPYTGGNFAGIWVLGDHNPVMRYNVVYGTVMSIVDSEAFDCDWGNTGTCTVEYNYSHDNAGGAFMNCDGCGTSGGATQIIRYNIFENDCRMHTSGNVTMHFYQNVMYCPDKNFAVAVPPNTTLENNIFIGNNNSTLPTGPNITWNWNVFQGVDSPSANGIVGDPVFLNPGHGGNTLDSVDGYKLRKTSPALHNGGIIQNNGGHDYYGNAVPSSSKPNRGVYEGPGL